MCQCPERATLISTVNEDDDEDENELCQCPERATLISTPQVYSNN